jgi:putative transposase
MKSIKIRLELNDKQKSYALQHCGVARHAWNWGLGLCKAIDIQNNTLPKEEKIKYPSAIDLHKLLVKDVKSVHAWYYESSKCSPQEALRNLSKAYSTFFLALKNGTIEKKKASYIKQQKSKGQPVNYDFLKDIGKPKFKKKGQKDNFYLEGAIQTKGNKIKVPKFGWLKCSETLPQCEIKNCVISRTADEWFISFKVPFTPVLTEKKQQSVGVDLGIKTLATLSTGVVFENKRPYKAAKRKLKIAQRLMSKKFVKGAKNQSNNYKKAALKVAKIHQKVANIRKDTLHKLTSYLCKNHAEIVIEDLNVSGMSKNKKLSSAILDGGFFEFRRQCQYKSDWYGATLTVVDRFFPSSKTCSSCSEVKATLKLSERVFKCNACGYEADRDLNASYNLRNKAVSYTVSACGVSNNQIPIVSGGGHIEAGNRPQT